MLGNAAEVVLTITDDEGETQTETAPLSSTSAQFVLKLELGNTYTFEASARDSADVELFQGTSSPYFASASGTLVLNLNPVQGLAGTIRASDQGGSGDLGGQADIPALAPQAMATYWGDLGSTGAAFVFNNPAPLELYVQTPDGEPITLDGLTLPLAALGGSTEFRATFYNPGTTSSTAVAGFGTFRIPLQSFAVVGPTSIDVGEVAAFTTDSPVPVNANDIDVTFSTASLAFSVTGTSVTGVAPGLGTLRAEDINGAAVDHILNVVERVVYNDQGTPWSLQPLSLPFKTISLAGTSNKLWALTANLGVHGFTNGLWSKEVPDAPTGALWLAAEGETVLAATTTTVWQFDGFTWSALTNAPTGVDIAGLAVVSNVLWMAGSDGALWSWDGVWSEGPALPTGFAALGGSSELLALTATQVMSFDGSQWNNGPAAIDSTVSIAQAFGAKYSLVVR